MDESKKETPAEIKFKIKSWFVMYIMFPFFTFISGVFAYFGLFGTPNADLLVYTIGFVSAIAFFYFPLAIVINIKVSLDRETLTRERLLEWLKDAGTPLLIIPPLGLAFFWLRFQYQRQFKKLDRMYVKG